MPGVSYGVARIFHAYGKNIYLKPDRSQVIASLIRKAVRYPCRGLRRLGRREPEAVFRLYRGRARRADEAREARPSSVGASRSTSGRQRRPRSGTSPSAVIRLSKKDIPLKFDESKLTGALNRMPDLDEGEAASSAGPLPPPSPRGSRRRSTGQRKSRGSWLRTQGTTGRLRRCLLEEAGASRAQVAATAFVVASRLAGSRLRRHLARSGRPPRRLPRPRPRLESSTSSSSATSTSTLDADVLGNLLPAFLVELHLDLDSSSASRPRAPPPRPRARADSPRHHHPDGERGVRQRHREPLRPLPEQPGLEVRARRRLLRGGAPLAPELPGPRGGEHLRGDQRLPAGAVQPARAT